MMILVSPILNRTRKGSGNHTGRCAHCKVVFKALKPGRAKAHLRKIKGTGIQHCHKVPKEVHAFYKLAPALLSKQATQNKLISSSATPI